MIQTKTKTIKKSVNQNPKSYPIVSEELEI